MAGNRGHSVFAPPGEPVAPGKLVDTGISEVSVSPIAVVPGINRRGEGQSDDEAEDVRVEENGVQRVGIPKEGKFVRKMLDPCKPSKEAVEMHWLQGHVVFRNWCPVCVSPSQRMIRINPIMVRKGGCWNTVLIIVSLGMSLVINSQF